MEGNTRALQVRNVATGTLVARVSLPDPRLLPGYRVDPATVATGDGRHYLVAISGSPCRTWLYQFQLNDRGQPSAVTTFAALPAVGSELRGLTVSANGQMIGYTTTDCTGAEPQPSYVAATNVRTGQTTRWTVPGSAADRGRTVVRAAQFGGSEWVLFAAITPGGKAVYFTTYPERFAGEWAGQVRELNLATGR